MAHGVDVDVVDGQAIIGFADSAVKAEHLSKLIAIAGPTGVKVDTGGTRRTYLVSEDVASEAGLIDKPKRTGGRKSSS